MSQTHLFNTDGVACYLTTIGDTGVAGVTGMAGILRETSVITRASVTGVAGAAGYTGVTGVAGVNTWLITRVLTRASDIGVTDSSIECRLGRRSLQGRLDRCDRCHRSEGRSQNM